MLRIYRHRVNTVDELERTSPALGIEFDLRSDGDNVIVTHDPFTHGPTIEEFFPHIGQRPCIFNVKCEGIEERVMSLAKQHHIEDYFFLDLSIPAAVKLVKKGETRMGVRYSEIEPIEGALAWAGKAQWAWVDCFTDFPLDESAWQKLAAAFRVCLVSPELQGHGTEAIAGAKTRLGNRVYHAACSKRPDLWSNP